MLSPHNPRQNHLLAALPAADYTRLAHDDLESAFRLVRLGHHVGWRVLYIVYSKRTIRHYEEILGMPIRELFEPTSPFETTGPSTHRSKAYRLIEGLTKPMRL